MLIWVEIFQKPLKFKYSVVINHYAHRHRLENGDPPSRAHLLTERWDPVYHVREKMSCFCAG